MDVVDICCCNLEAALIKMDSLCLEEPQPPTLLKYLLPLPSGGVGDDDDDWACLGFLSHILISIMSPG